MDGYPHWIVLDMLKCFRAEGLDMHDVSRLKNPDIVRGLKLVLDGRAEIVEVSSEPILEYRGLPGQIPHLEEDLTVNHADHDFGEAEHEYGIS